MSKNKILLLSILQTSLFFFGGCSEEKAYADRVITEMAQNLAQSDARTVFGSDSATDEANIGEPNG